MSIVPEESTPAGEGITAEQVEMLRTATEQQQRDIAAVLGHLAPQMPCPPWCDKKGDAEYPCRGDHWGTIGAPVNGATAQAPQDPDQGDPVPLPMVETQIAWCEMNREGLMFSLYDRASDVAWEFDASRLTELIANLTLAVRTVLEDGRGVFPGFDFPQVVDNVEAIAARTMKRDAA